MVNSRRVLTLKEKCKIIQKLESGESQSTIVKTFKISSSTVSRLWKEKIKILSAKINMPGINSKIRSTNHSDLEEKLFIWFREARAKGLPITGKILMEKANDIGKNIGMINFDCSMGWIDRFKKRHDIKSGFISGESKSVDITTVIDWYQEVWPNIREGYKDEDIFNADETGLFYKCTPQNTLRLKGENCSGGKLSKERVTILLCASATGEKFEPLIIGKYAKPRCFKNQNLSYFDYKSNKKAWMTSSLFSDQLSKWDSMLRTKKRKIILIVDNCSSHPKINDILTNIKLVFLPANTTSVLQPCDQGIIKNFKHNYRQIIIIKIIQAFDLKKEFNIHMLDALHFIKQAWKEVTAKTIINSFYHSKIIQRDEYLNDINEQTSLVRTFENKAPELFKTKEDLINFIDVDENIVNSEEIFEEKDDDNEENYILTEPFQINDKISLLDAIAASDIIKTFCLTSNGANEIYPYVCKIENYFDKEYLTSKIHQRTLLDYDFTKSTM